MRAAVVRAYGGPEVIHIEEIDLPKPGPGQVRIKIRASSVNPHDAAAPSIFATAYGGLFLRSDLKAGQTVLIHGGAGVIGSCAVQLAKQAGARVIATASGQNVERAAA